MVATGNRAGTRTAALITNMSQPLGRMAGNAAEIVESVEVLRNHRHPLTEDLRRLSLELAGWMLYLGGKVRYPGRGNPVGGGAVDRRPSAQEIRLHDCRAGGRPGLVREPAMAAPAGLSAAGQIPVRGLSGQRRLRPGGVGGAALGAGRTVPGEAVSAHAGVETHKKVGDPVAAGDTIFTVYVEDEARLPPVVATLNQCFTLSAERPAPEPLVYQVIS